MKATQSAWERFIANISASYSDFELDVAGDIAVKRLEKIQVNPEAQSMRLTDARATAMILYQDAIGRHAYYKIHKQNYGTLSIDEFSDCMVDFVNRRISYLTKLQKSDSVIFADVHTLIETDIIAASISFMSKDKQHENNIDSCEEVESVGVVALGSIVDSSCKSKVGNAIDGRVIYRLPVLTTEKTIEILTDLEKSGDDKAVVVVDSIIDGVDNFEYKFSSKRKDVIVKLCSECADPDVTEAMHLLTGANEDGGVSFTRANSIFDELFANQHQNVCTVKSDRFAVELAKNAFSYFSDLVNTKWAPSLKDLISAIFDFSSEIPDYKLHGYKLQDAERFAACVLGAALLRDCFSVCSVRKAMRKMLKNSQRQRNVKAWMDLVTN